MEQVLARFPHLGDKIFQNLNSHTLIRCKEVNKSWENFIKVEKSCYLRIIKWYTNYSEPLIKKIIEKFGGAIIAVSILREIFRSNRPLLIGWHMMICQVPGGNWKYYMNHTTKFTKDFRDPTKSLPDGWVWSTTPEGTICYIHPSCNMAWASNIPGTSAEETPICPESRPMGANLGQSYRKTQTTITSIPTTKMDHGNFRQLSKL
mgnify:CR=1 FL=1